MLAVSLLAFTLSPFRAIEPEPIRVSGRNHPHHLVAGARLPAALDL